MYHADPHQLLHEIDLLRQEHEDLDDVIRRVSDDPSMDQLRLKRMKKRKLQLKDAITRLQSRLIPDLDA